MIDIINTIALTIGYFVIALFVWWFILCCVVYSKDEDDDYVLFTIFGFGFIRIPHTNKKLINNINKVKSAKAISWKTDNYVFFVNAPTWFNKYIWNIGGVK